MRELWEFCRKLSNPERLGLLEKTYRLKGEGLTMNESELGVRSIARRSIAVLGGMVLTLAIGCESAHVGMGIPIPGPVKPSVGVSVNKSGVKGHGGVSAKVGPVPVSVGGTTKPVNLSEASEPSKSTKKSK